MVLLMDLSTVFNNSSTLVFMRTTQYIELTTTNIASIHMAQILHMVVLAVTVYLVLFGAESAELAISAINSVPNVMAKVLALIVLVSNE